jgi:hypothetical protein
VLCSWFYPGAGPFLNIQLSSHLSEAVGLGRDRKNWQLLAIATDDSSVPYTVIPEYPFVALKSPCWFLKWAVNARGVEVGVTPDMDVDLFVVKDVSGGGGARIRLEPWSAAELFRDTV